MAEDLELQLTSLVGRQESPSSLVRFEDETDAHAPRLNYAVPLPGAYEGRFYIETDFGQVNWLPAASRFGKNPGGGIDPRVVLDLDLSTLELEPGTPSSDGTVILPLERVALSPRPAIATTDNVALFNTTRRINTLAAPTIAATVEEDGGSAPALANGLVKKNGQWFVQADDYQVSWTEVRAQAEQNRSLVFYKTFGGTMAHTYVNMAIDDLDANPRFIIIEHYRLTSHFGDYGAGRTVKTFSLMPGEETRVYIRDWKRTEQRRKEASSIFDSYTAEAANDFETSMEDENTDKEGYNKTRQWHVKGSASVNFGIGKSRAGASIEAGGGGTTQQTRESMAKSVAKTATHHSSKASSKRETTVSTELESTEAAEFETITERQIKNVNLSRTLNVVARELNQEFTTYFALIDVTVAFANDRGVFDEVRIHELDDLLARYLPPPPSGPTEGGVVLSGGGSNVSDYTRIRMALVAQMITVFDYRGQAKQFLEVAEDFAGNEYLRVVRSSDADRPNPHYPDNSVPVEGVVMDKSTHTVRTDAVIVDSLLGHGVALDNYALGMQQETLRRQQMENRKIELAIELIESGDIVRLDAYRSIFGSVDSELLKEVALHDND